MNKFVSNFKWIMLICGLLTCSMFLGLFSPESSLESNFGEPLVTGPENIVVRGWSALIGLIGIMLIYGAFKPAVRDYSLVIAGMSKTIFVILVLSFGSQYMSFGAGTAVIVDIIMILLFVLYLIFSKSSESTPTKV
ncbi:hypothetical protein [Cognataquiflexum rubidum]|uniref:hypothetical protein n=1 Tax=Cognataquiflexum rubidum TaxID=2922273 RepID=UPI001F12CB19|nr:hypothetical protein [Cognataquiflexum rubidum]MCH6233790.1 hypothetical protein [Cognataquiflexum rubidum]